MDDDLALLVTQVRRLPEDATAAWELEHLVFTTELIVSELVTNAIRYGGAPVGPAADSGSTSDLRGLRSQPDAAASATGPVDG
ncbi:hypothetical protein GCM10010228_64810 [Streptomyces massasporeus]|nr:hypothetical protein GCM10010228_64810 [Streptomyces massasporeus]